MNTQLTIRSAITVTAVAAALQAIAIGAASAQTVLKFAWQLPLTNYASKGAERVAQCIQEKSAAAIKIETFPAGQLYRAGSFTRPRARGRSTWRCSRSDRFPPPIR